MFKLMHKCHFPSYAEKPHFPMNSNECRVFLGSQGAKPVVDEVLAVNKTSPSSGNITEEEMKGCEKHLCPFIFLFLHHSLCFYFSL